MRITGRIWSGIRSAAAAAIALLTVVTWAQLGMVVPAGLPSAQLEALVIGLALAPGLFVTAVAARRRAIDDHGLDHQGARNDGGEGRSDAVLGPAQAAGAGLILIGTGLILTGGVTTLHDGPERLRIVRALGRGTLAWVADLHLPYPLIAAGLAYSLVGLGTWYDRDRRVRFGALLAALVSIGFAADLAVVSVLRGVIGLVHVNQAGLALAGCLAVAGLLQVSAVGSGRLSLQRTSPATADLDAAGAASATGAASADGIAAPTADTASADGAVRADGAASARSREGDAGRARRRPRPVKALVAAATVGVLVTAAGGLTWRSWWPGRSVADLFPDPVLAGCVASTLGLGPGDAVRNKDLASILALGCHGGRNGGLLVRDATGLEHLPALVTLNLADNQITDLTPIRRLPHPERLHTLKLTGNRVTDLSPLSGLTQVWELGLSDNAVSDLGPLRGLTAVRELGVARNQIHDLTPLSGMTQLTWLDVSDNQIRDIAVVARFTLAEKIVLTRNQAADLTPLGGLPHLSRLDVALNRVQDVGPLGRSGTLEELWLGGNPVHDLTPLVRIRSLTGVDVHESNPATLIGVDRLRAKGVYVGGTA
jgi:hypothetical protein